MVSKSGIGLRFALNLNTNAMKYNCIAFSINKRIVSIRTKLIYSLRKCIGFSLVVSKTNDEFKSTLIRNEENFSLNLEKH